MNPLLLTDYYKVEHQKMYPEGTTLIYSNLTPRKSRIKGVNSVVFFGLQHFILEYLIKKFDKEFFIFPKEWKRKAPLDNSIISNTRKKVIDEYSKHIQVDTKHIEALWDLGYLPIEIKAVDEGTSIPIGVPVLTIKNTLPEFYWLTNYLETLISTSLWQPITSATIANEYRKLLNKYAKETTGTTEGVQWQAHDFSLRGMSSIESGINSGMAHLTSFTGTDVIPAIYQLEESYDAKGLIGASVPATEHSVMCMGTKESEIETFKRLLDLYPEGILSVVSDTWDLWKVCTEYVTELKEQILARNGKLVIRPDSGDPVDIICGELNSNYYLITNEVITKNSDEYKTGLFAGKNAKFEYITDFWKNINETIFYTDNKYYYEYRWISWGEGDGQWVIGDKIDLIDSPKSKGVIELLWDVFGGTINDQGYKVLDSHIGAIYGDSITLERAKEICERLKAKGFASTNIVFGVGSFTYQYNTRDTFGFAIKATYGEITEEGFEYPVKLLGESSKGMEVQVLEDPKPYKKVECREIFKDPITDDGTKRSAKGLLQVTEELKLKDQCSWEEESKGILTTVFKDGKLVKRTNLEEIRERIKNG